MSNEEDSRLTETSVEESALATLEKVTSRVDPAKPGYIKRKDLPEPSSTRLQATLGEHAFDLQSVTKDGLPHEIGAKPEAPKTVFYLAYGSNLCAETFQGHRGVRPISALNVVVPDLSLTFDLPGIPYNEPCFANTKYRKASDGPPIRSSGDAINEVPYWPRGLVGVVYEISLEDFAHVMATEGGGAAYQDVLIDCFPLPQGADHVPAEPTATAFKAHTLYCPVYPPGKAPPGSNAKSGRANPGYAQPSRRYLKLLIDGANEHSLPLDYRMYLSKLQPYVMTTRGQRNGAFVLNWTWIPILLKVLALQRRFTDEKGRGASWTTPIVTSVFRGIWITYDNFLVRVFGDGERTQPVNPS